MYVQVQTDHSLIEKLNAASVSRRCFPWDPQHIDWSVPIDDEHLYLPEGHSFASHTPVWERLTLAEKSYLTRWEFTQMMRNAGFGEHLLNQGILALLHHTTQYDPGWRFMLHEVAEECQHMAMFNHWVRLNADIRTWGLRDHQWGLAASMLTPVIATQATSFFWILVMLFEVVGEEVINAAAAQKSGDLHPIVHQIARAHRTEEARHIAFAKDWIARRLPETSRAYRAGVQLVAERVLYRVLRYGIPVFYSKQIAHILTREELNAATHSEHRRKLASRQARPTIEEFLELGALRPDTVRGWERKGLLLPA